MRRSRLKKQFLLAVFVASLGGSGAVALADSTPIGRLPNGPVSSIETRRGELVAIALPRRGAGRVWRIARPVKSSVIRQVGESDVGTSVVLVFRAVSMGSATISVALTKGDTSSKALESRRFTVRVR